MGLLTKMFPKNFDRFLLPGGRFSTKNGVIGVIWHDLLTQMFPQHTDLSLKVTSRCPKRKEMPPKKTKLIWAKTGQNWRQSALRAIQI